MCYDAIRSRDARFDGRFVTAVTSTGVYCRPSCPSRTPRFENVRFFATPGAARAAGYRACRRCHPDAVGDSGSVRAGRLPVPGTPAGLPGADAADPVPGSVHADVAEWAREVGMSPRHLRRRLVSETGVTPRTLIGSVRMRTAVELLRHSTLPVTDVAFAAGFASLRAFEEATQRAFGVTPSALRNAPDAPALGPEGPSPDRMPFGPALPLRLPFRAPMETRDLFRFLAVRAVPGLEEVAGDGTAYRRVLRLPHGLGIAEARLTDDPQAEFIDLRVHLEDLADLGNAVEAMRYLLDVDADPAAIGAVLSQEPLLADAVQRHPGRRVPGHVDGAELAIRAVLGQQVSVAAARTHTTRLVERYGDPLPEPFGSLRFAFPTPERLAKAGPALPGMALPARRLATVHRLALALVEGQVPPLRPGTDPGQATACLLTLPGIGPWTTAYIALRALSDPDAFPAADLGILQALGSYLGRPVTARAAERLAEAWRPFRAYAVMHLWSEPEGPAAYPGGGPDRAETRPLRESTTPRSEADRHGPESPSEE